MLSSTKKYLVIITPILPKDRELTEKDKRISVNPEFFEPILNKYCYWEKSIIEKDLPVAIYTCKNK